MLWILEFTLIERSKILKYQKSPKAGVQGAAGQFHETITAVNTGEFTAVGINECRETLRP